MIALFGIAWMADTFIANNEDAIVQALGSLAENWPFTIAIAIFLVAGLTTSQSAATRTMVPLGLALGIGAGYMIAMWTAVAGVLFLPANGTQIAAAEADTTGTTHSRQEGRRPLLPAAAAGLLDRDGTGGDGHRLAVLRRPHARPADADNGRNSLT